MWRGLCVMPARRSLIVLACAFGVTLAGCDPTPSSETAPPTSAPIAALDVAAATPDTPAGRYAKVGERTGMLTLDDTGSGWRIALQGGGAAADGAAAAADCDLQAQGTLREGRIAASVVPFETERMSVTEADLAAQPARVLVTLDGDSAIVETDFALCGLGADLSGHYARSD